ncbi:MAG: DinB family protein [Burkholderiales bacterium]|nr:DinB family protein [Burkholderiales bacterium]
MTSTRTARLLTRYNAWANRVIFDAVGALPPGEATKERPSLFRSMVKTLNHLYVVDLIWQAHLEGRPHGIPALNTVLHPELPALQAAQHDLDAWFIAWSDGLVPADLDRRVSFTLLSGNHGEMAVRDIVFHFVNHTSYHRGFVANLFYQVPAVPPLTDLPIYLREHGEP